MPLQETQRQNLAEQVRWLTGSLEYHLLGNHLLANAKALVFAGVFFGGDEGNAWLRQVRRFTTSNFLSKFCPMAVTRAQPNVSLHNTRRSARCLNLSRYAKHVVQSFTQPCKTGCRKFRRCDHCASSDASSRWSDRPFQRCGTRIVRPLRVGSICRALDLGATPTINDGVTWLESSGYIRYQTDNTVLIVDVAQIGPDYIPGHAHADTLTFELSIRGQRTIVNSGTSVYRHWCTTATRTKHPGTQYNRDRR